VVALLVIGPGTWPREGARAATSSESAFVARRAYETGLALVRSRQAVASLPHFERALELTPDVWVLHGDYASALANAALESYRRRGRSMSYVRSSHERVAIIRHAFERLDVAERMAPPPPENIAFLRYSRSKLLHIWALDWEALGEMERAVAADPSWPMARRDRQTLLQLMGLPATFPMPAR
jgi:hypothetical protein